MSVQPDVAPSPEGRASRVGALSARLDQPWLPGVILSVAGVAFVIARWHRAAHVGGLGAFVVAGSMFVKGPPATSHVIVSYLGGYDGQFYYRLAMAPWDFSKTAYGITMDYPIRFGRIGYPFLAWVFSFGNASLVTKSLVAVNVASLALLGWLCGIWARKLGSHALWGLLPAGYFGFLYSISRDLTEVSAAMFMVAGLVAVKSDRVVLAAAAFSCAALCRETALIAVLALGASSVYSMVRTKARPTTKDLAWVVPLGVFFLWQLIVKLSIGQFPILTDKSSNSSLPFVGMVHAVAQYSDGTGRIPFYLYLSFTALSVLSVFALASLGRRTQASRAEQWGFCLALLVIVCLSQQIWLGDPVQYRTFAEVWVLGSGVLLGTSWKRLVVPSVLGAITWLVIAQWMASTI